ncbi:MAG TPA: ECF-type sigma factor [Blastocatellia bacterium]|nr:ECF-type sigma factor [Blastocatellia bacterium]HMY73641.1 ECF-type sigma factor [Blastocatellia bacterium]HMZ19583.1 ECF-type sigma factor [Blastocatellia bacterium]
MNAAQFPITALLQAWQAGDVAAFDQLTPLVYGEVRRIAAALLARRRAPLQPTEVTNEVFARLLRQKKLKLEDRHHFYAFCATVIRNVLVDHFRRQPAQTSVSSVELEMPERECSLPALDDALRDLARLDQRAARVVELRFFGGLTEEEIAEVMHISVPTVKRDWRKAKAWLARQLRGANA